MSVIVFYRLPARQDRRRSYRIEIDGQLVGRLGSAGTLRVPVAAGVHDLRARIDWTSTPVVGVSLRNDEERRVYVGPAKGRLSLLKLLQNRWIVLVPDPGEADHSASEATGASGRIDESALATAGRTGSDGVRAGVVRTGSAERLSRRTRFKVTGESARLDDAETVQRWLRELRPESDQQILVHRPWGTMLAVADKIHPMAVLLTVGERSWFAVPPGADDDAELTADQIETIMLDALTSETRPAWPDWRPLS
jgi:hypothetical protein